MQSQQAGPSCPRRQSVRIRTSRSMASHSSTLAAARSEAACAPTVAAQASIIPVSTASIVHADALRRPSSSLSALCRPTSSPSTTRSGPSLAARRSLSFARTATTFLFAFLLFAATSTLQVQAGEPNNITSLSGTWSTGAGHVKTGLSFFNPGNGTFTVPATAGQSYSFTDDGYWEEALYMYETNPAKPSCVSAQLIWQHGTYTLNSNNTLTLNIFDGDGRQQLEDRCTSESSSTSSYNQKENMEGFEIGLDTHYGQSAYYLQLYEYDGSKKPLMWQIYNPPEMLPTEQLHMKIYGQTA